MSLAVTFYAIDRQKQMTGDLQANYSFANVQEKQSFNIRAFIQLFNQTMSKK